mmetsp:Transcript_22958/g.53596  ORF Transcript_22958/g.53596 Transcript_22958/m.53596 type:complete len:230 (+) Transcript_22958:1216-1905(+)
MILGVVARTHGVTAREVEEVSRTTQDSLFNCCATAEAKVVQPTVKKKLGLGVDTLLECTSNKLTRVSRECSNSAGVPNHGQNSLEESAEPRVLFHGRDLEHRRVDVRNSTFGKCLELNGNVALILTNELEEQIFGKRVRDTPRIVGTIELFCCGDVCFCPGTTQEIFNNMSNAVEHEAVIPHSCIGFSEFSIGNHFIRLRVHQKMASLVGICHDSHWSLEPPVARKELS